MPKNSTCVFCEEGAASFNCGRCSHPTCSDCGDADISWCSTCVEAAWDYDRDGPVDLTCAVCGDSNWGEGYWGHDLDRTFIGGCCWRGAPVERIALWVKAGASPCIHPDCKEELRLDELCKQHKLMSMLSFLGDPA